MSTEAFLQSLRAHKVELWADGEQLRVRGPEEHLTAELKQELGRRKRAILEHLKDEATRAASALSSPQQSLWSFYQNEPDNLAYNVACAFRLHTPVSRSALNEAFIQLQKRHDVLRTTVAQTPKGPRPHTREHYLAELEVDVVTDRSEEEALEAVVDRPFDLENGPVARLTLVRLPGDAEILVFQCHHIAVDFWAMELLAAELATLYESALQSASVKLASPGPGYRAFVEAERAYLASPAAESDKAFWVAELAGDLQVTEIGRAKPAAASRSLSGATVRRPWQRERVSSIRAAAAQLGVSPFVYLLSVYYLLLSRYASLTDVVVGVPSTLRSAYRGESTIGNFVNTLPVRMRIDPKLAFSAWVKAVNEKVLSCLDHQAYPFPAIAQAIPLQRTSRHSPVFQTIFNLQQGRSDLQDKPRAVFGDMFFSTSNGVKGAAYELSLMISLIDEQSEKVWNYSDDRVDSEYVRELDASFELLLDQVAASPDMPLNALRSSEFGAAVRRRESAATGDARTYHPELLHEAFRAQARATPHDVAVLDAKRKLSYEELDAASDRVAEWLLSSGAVRPEAIVAVLMGRRVEVVVAFLAILKAGGVCLPLDARHPRARLATVLENAGACLLIHDEENAALAAGLPVAGQSYELLESASAGLDPRLVRGLDLSATQLSHIIYTSGSTGVPKGVAIEHRNVLSLFRNSARFYEPSDLERSLASASICFDISIYEIFLPLVVGGSTLLIERSTELPDSDRLAGVTLVNAVASVLKVMLAQKKLPDSVRVMVSCGEPLLRPLADQIYELPHVEKLYNQYAPSEACIHATLSLVSRNPDDGINIGRPIEGNIYLLDEWGNEVPPGVVGEIYLSTNGVTRGYLNAPALTAEKFVPDPFADIPGRRMYRTGDFARQLPSGDVEYVSRMDSQIKLRGFRIELQDIESTMLKLRDIQSTAVKLQRDESGRAFLVGYVETRDQEHFDPESLKSRLAEQLPHYMIPEFFCELPSLPRNSNGKIDRKALPDYSIARADAGEADAARRDERNDDETYALVGSIWRDVLAVPSIAANDNFFRLGGHSLSAATVVARINQSLGTSLRSTTLFDVPRYADFAALVAGKVGYDASVPLLTAQEGKAAEGAVSFMQRGMWLETQRGRTESTAYNAGIGIRMQGPLDTSRLRAALRELCRRQSSLRTVFALSKGELRSEVTDTVDVPLGVQELDESSISAAAKAFLALPMSIETGPLLEAKLFVHSPTRRTLILKMHHMVSDGRSMRIVVDELRELYQNGSEARLPRLPVSYQEFAFSLARWMESPEAEQRRGYWKRALADLPEPLAMPTDLARPRSRSFVGDEVEFRVPEELASRLSELALSSDVTPFMLYHSAFALLLSRYSGRNELILGAPYSCRRQDSLRDLVGLFVNILPLRVRIDAGESFRALLKRQRKEVVAHFAHADLPFESMIEEVEIERNLHEYPIVQATFAYEHIGDAAYDLDGGQWQLVRTPEHASKFEMSMQLLEMDGELSGYLTFDSSIYSRARMQELSEQWLVLLECLAASPGEPLYSVHAGAGRALGAEPMTGTRPACIHERFEELAWSSPDQPALQDGDVGMSYSELDEAAERLASVLLERGVPRMGRVGLYMDMSARAVVAMLAVWKLGGAYVPIDRGTPSGRLAYVCDDAKLHALIHDDSVSVVASALGALPCWEIGRLLRAEASCSRPSGGASPAALAYIIYTSGSSGRPKGVAVSHASLSSLVDWHVDRYGTGLGARASKLAGFGFDASVWEIWPYLCSGGTLFIADRDTRMSPSRLCAWLDRHRIEYCFLATPVAESLLRDPRAKRLGLKFLLTGGDRLTFNDVAELPFEVVNHYGPTENTVVATAGTVEPEAWRPGIGTAIANTAVLLLDRDLVPVLDGAAGEIFLAGPALAYGYFGQPALTAERFVPCPFAAKPGARMYRTGDLAKRRGAALDFIGRADEQIKRAGHRIELGEIGRSIESVPGVAAAIAYVRRDENGTESLVAALKTDADSDGSNLVVAVDSALREMLPDYMLPEGYQLCSELPLTANGKTDYRALSALELHVPRQSDYVAPRTDDEQKLARLFEAHLRTAPVGVTDDFFQLGGQSVVAMQMVADIEDELGVECSITTFFENPTVGSLAEALRVARGAGDVRGLPKLEHRPEERYEPFPLTEIQQTYLVGRADLYALGDIATQAYSEVDVDVLDRPRFERAFRAVIDRHEALRIVLTQDQQQRILEEVPPYEVAFRDLAGYDARAAEDALEEIRAQMSQQVRSGYEWPLFESRITRLPDGRYRLHFMVDGLIADGFSVQIMSNDFMHYYLGLEDELRPLTVSFRDYVVAKEAVKETRLYEESRKYWMDRIESLPGAPQLPVSPHRVRKARGQFRSRTRRLSKESWALLKRRAQDHGLTPSVLLMSAYAAVLASFSRSAHFTLNVTLFNRLPLHPDIDRIMGDFTSLMLLEVDGAEGSLLSLADKLKRQFWQDLEHRHYSGLELLRERMRRDGGSTSAVMPVVFTSAVGNESFVDGFEVVKANADEHDLQQLFGEGFSVSQTSQVWLDHAVYEENGQLRLNWQSVDALFDGNVVDEMFAAYSRLLDEILDSGRSLEQISTNRFPPAQAALRDAINEPTGEASTLLLHELVERQVSRTPDAQAVMTNEITIRYGELWSASGRLARRLRELGVTRGSRVGIVMEKGWEQVVAVLAVLRSGGAYVPIEGALPRARQRQLLELVEPAAILVQSRHEGDLWKRDVAVVTVDRDLLAARDDESSVEAVPGACADDLAYVIFTSGSTGTPKGVMIDHAGAVNTVLDVNERFGIGGVDRTLGLSSLGFDLSVYDIFGPLAVGGALVLPNPDELKDPSAWRGLIERFDVTVLNAVPALMQLLVNLHEQRNLLLPASLRLALLSGDWIPVTLPDRIWAVAHEPGVSVVSLGGATEASIWSVFHCVTESTRALKSVPYGKPLTNQSLHVLREDLSPCPDWVPGDLYIGGRGLAKGYWRDPEKTAKSFITHPRTGERLYRTGDKARYTRDGVIEFLGREDTQVKVRGYRIELEEIENTLASHPFVSEAVATVQKSGDDARIVGYVVPAHGSSLEPHEKLALQVSKPGIREDLTLRVALPKPEPIRFCRSADERGTGFARERLGAWLACIAQHRIGGALLPKYYYPSAGSLNPVQTYVVLREDFGPGLDAGVYYYHPGDHALCRIEKASAPEHRGPGSSLVTTVLVAELSAIEPAYPGLADDFCRLEAGYMHALLRGHGRALGLEPSAIGEDPRFGGALALRESQRYLLHADWQVVEDEAADAAPGAARELTLTGRQSFRTFEGGRPDPEALAEVIGALRELAPGFDAALEALLHVRNDTGQYQRGFYAVGSEGLTYLGEKTLERHYFSGPNVQIYESADLALLLVAKSAAARREALVESGIVGQHVMSIAASSRIGWCPIGTMDFAPIRDALGLSPDSSLAHCLVGGVVSAAQLETPSADAAASAPDLQTELQRFLKDQLPEYMVPATIVAVDAFPLSANGKVARDRLPRIESRPIRVRQKQRPRTATEKRICELWKDILGIDEVELDQTFFELGGNSMLLIKAHSRMRDMFSKELAVVDLFNYPSVAALAEHIDGPDATEADFTELRIQSERRRDSLARLRGLRGQ